MKIEDIDLKNIKVVIFDFDDTLAIHKDKEYGKHRMENEENDRNYYLNAYKNPNTFYDSIEKCTKSDVLHNFIINLRKKNIKIYCLSGMKFSFNLKAKQYFINKYYGDDIEVISAASQELKPDGVKIIQQLNNCKLEEILFIDDNKNVIELLSKSGINAIFVKGLEV